MGKLLLQHVSRLKEQSQPGRWFRKVPYEYVNQSWLSVKVSVLASVQEEVALPV